MTAKELLESINQEPDDYFKMTKILGLKEYLISQMDEKGIKNNSVYNPIMWHQLHNLMKVADMDLKKLCLVYAKALNIYVHPSMR